MRNDDEIGEAVRAIVAPRAAMKPVARRHHIGHERQQTKCPELTGWAGLPTRGSMDPTHDGESMTL